MEDIKALNELISDLWQSCRKCSSKNIRQELITLVRDSTYAVVIIDSYVAIREHMEDLDMNDL